MWPNSCPHQQLLCFNFNSYIQEHCTKYDHLCGLRFKARVLVGDTSNSTHISSCWVNKLKNTQPNWHSLRWDQLINKDPPIYLCIYLSIYLYVNSSQIRRFRSILIVFFGVCVRVFVKHFVYVKNGSHIHIFSLKQYKKQWYIVFIENKGFFIHEIEGPWPLALIKTSHWSKGRDLAIHFT